MDRLLLLLRDLDYHEAIISPVTWLVLAAIVVILYMINSRLGLPVHLNVSNIFVQYILIFPEKKDLWFFIILPFFFAVATNLESLMNADISNIMCVVISILAASVVSFMAMTSDRADFILEKSKKERNISDQRILSRNRECLAIGMFEILISIILLILIFLFPIFHENNKVYWFISLVIYYTFYVFLFNLFVMMRRLYQIYQK